MPSSTSRMRLPQMPSVWSLAAYGEHLPCSWLSAILHTFVYCLCHFGRVAEFSRGRINVAGRSTIARGEFGWTPCLHGVCERYAWGQRRIWPHNFLAGTRLGVSDKVLGEQLDSAQTYFHDLQWSHSNQKVLLTQIAQSFRTEAFCTPTAPYHADVFTRSLGSRRRQPILLLCLQRIPTDNRFHAPDYRSLPHHPLRFESVFRLPSTVRHPSFSRLRFRSSVHDLWCWRLCLKSTGLSGSTVLLDTENYIPQDRSI